MTTHVCKPVGTRNESFEYLIHDNLSPGDEIVLSPGKYSYDVLAQNPKQKDVTIRADGKVELVGKTVLSAPGTRFIGMDITSNSNGVWVTGSNIEVANCYIHDCAYMGILAAEDGDVNIYGNIICWCNNSHGIFASGHGNKVIENNVIFECGKMNVQVYNEFNDISGFTVRGNILFAPYIGNLVVGTMKHTTSNVLVEDNMCLYPIGTRKPPLGVNIGWHSVGGKNVVVRNNTVVGAEYGISVKGVDNPVLDGNRTNRELVEYSAVKELGNVPDHILRVYTNKYDPKRLVVMMFNKDRVTNGVLAKMDASNPLYKAGMDMFFHNTPRPDGINRQVATAEVKNVWLLDVDVSPLVSGLIQSANNVLDIGDDRHHGVFQDKQFSGGRLPITVNWYNYVPEFAVFLVNLQ